MVKTIAPLACPKPAAKLADWPKLRRKRITRTWGSLFARPLSTAKESSWLPSSKNRKSRMSKSKAFLAANHPVILGSSTHPGEESLLLDCLGSLGDGGPLQLLGTPRECPRPLLAGPHGQARLDLAGQAGEPERPGRAPERQALAGAVDVEGVAKHQVVGVGTGKPPLEHLEAPTAVARPRDDDLPVDDQRSPLCQKVLGDRPLLVVWLAAQDNHVLRVDQNERELGWPGGW